MGRKKKNGNKPSLEKIVFVTVCFELLKAILDFIKTLLE